MSKVGTKHAAIECQPERYLQTIGENAPPSEHDMTMAEEYLVRVYAGVRSSTKCVTFDEFRLECYLAGNSLDSLPPTSSVVLGHIRRGSYLIHLAQGLLDDN